MTTLIQWLNAQGLQSDICVDVDNTILDYDSKTKDPFGNFDKQSLKVLKDQVKKGRTVIVHTARKRSEWPAVSKHLKKLGIPFTKITNVKPNTCAAFIDDRAVTWDKTDNQRAPKATKQIDHLVKK